MKKQIVTFVMATGLLVGFTTSCQKCEECHYDGPGGEEVEIGELCDEDLENAEANGYAVGDTTYTVHCHEH
jgi:hypothetical protein